ncbi:unnamed protein product, partial [Brenthis ino]
MTAYELCILCSMHYAPWPCLAFLRHEAVSRGAMAEAAAEEGRGKGELHSTLEQTPPYVPRPRDYFVYRAEDVVNASPASSAVFVVLL